MFAEVAVQTKCEVTVTPADAAWALAPVRGRAAVKAASAIGASRAVGARRRCGRGRSTRCFITLAPFPTVDYAGEPAGHRPGRCSRVRPAQPPPPGERPGS